MSTSPDFNTTPPVIPTPSMGHHPSHGSFDDNAGPGRGTPRSNDTLEGAFAALRKLPARNTRNSVLGGVCSGVADRLGISAAAVRIGLVVLALAAGTGVGLYLLAWALMPDEAGRSHLEKGLKHGTGTSVVLLAIGGLVALSAVFSVLGILTSMLPGLIGIAIVGGLGYWGYRALNSR